MRTLRLSYVLVIAQVGKRGQGNSGGDGIRGRSVGRKHCGNVKAGDRLKRDQQVCETNAAPRAAVRSCQSRRGCATSYISAMATQATMVFLHLCEHCRCGARDVTVHEVANHCGPP